jgi:CHAT domain-containing protein
MLLLSTIHFYLGRYDTSGLMAEQAMRQALPLRDSSALALAYHLLGRICFDRARYDSAALFQRRSLVCARASGSLQSEADALRQLGVLYWYRGENDSARTVFYDKALNLYRTIGDRSGEATTLNNIGLLDGGIRYFLDAFYIRKRIGDQVGLADSYYFITSPVAGGHWNNLAYSFRLKSLTLSSKIGYAWGEEVAARAVDQMLFSSYDSLAIELAAADSVTRSGEGMILLLQLKASEHMRRGRLEESVRLRERIVFLCDSLKYTHGLAVALEQYTRALLRKGDNTRAERVARRYQEVMGRSLQGTWLLATVFLEEGRRDEAFQLLSTLLRRYDEEHEAGLYQGDVLWSESAGHILNRRYILYSMLMNSLDDQDDGHAFEFLERFRAMLVAFGPGRAGHASATGEESIWHRYLRLLEAIDGGQDAEGLLQDFYEEYAETATRQAISAEASPALYTQSIPRLDEVRDLLRSDQVLIEYFVGPEDAYVVAVRRDRSTFRRLEVDVRDLNTSGQVFHELILRGKTSPADTLWRRPASFLFSALLEPLLSDGILRQGDHLIISPHGQLHNVPFAALLDSQGVSSAERFLISYARSAADLFRPNRPPPFTTLALIPDNRSLRFSEIEVESIPDRLCRSKVILRDEEATSERLLRLMAGSDLIHIAAHGEVDQTHPMFSRLKLSNGPLELHRVVGLQLRSPLVVVSACETGYGIGMLGTLGHGHEAVSFPQAFLAAGASAVLSPLWVIEDEAASRLLEMFYSRLAELQGSPARALARAQRQFVRDARAGLSWNHPFYWAGFYLIGNPN